MHIHNIENSRSYISEYTKFKLCLAATALKNWWVEINNLDIHISLIIEFPMWMWYSENGDAVECKELSEDVLNILSIHMKWMNDYMYVFLCRKPGKLSEYARFDDYHEFEQFLNAINIHNYECSRQLFPDGCMPKLIYESNETTNFSSLNGLKEDEKKCGSENQSQ